MAFIQTTVANASNGSTGNIHPSLTGVAAGNTLIAWATQGGYTGGGFPPTDSSGQTWSQAFFTNYLNACTIECFYLLNANAGTHTLTWASNTGFAAMSLTEVPTCTAVDVVGTAVAATSGTATGATIPSITTLNANDTVMTGFGMGGNLSFLGLAQTASGWSTVNLGQDDDTTQALYVGYQELSATATVASGVSFTADPTGPTYAAVTVSFKRTASSNTAALTAVSSTSSVSGFGSGVTTSKAVTGNTATSSPGTAKANVTLALTGVAATGSVGTVVVPGAPAAATAVTATGSVTAMPAGVQLNLAGNATTSSPGTVKAGISQVAGAVTATSSTGAVGAGAAPALTAVVGTASVGTVGVLRAAALAGVSSTTSLGTTGANVSVALTGVSSTCSVGTLQPPGNQLSPVVTTGSVGTLALQVSHALSAVSSTGSPGTVQSTPQRPLTGVQGTGSVGSVTFGNVVVRLGGVTIIGSVGNLTPPATPDFKNGELFFAQQMALPFGYVDFPGNQRNRGAIFYASGQWTVPPGAGTVFCSASAGGGTPLGNAGDQSLQGTLSAVPGDILTVTMNPNGEVYVFKGANQLLFLRAGAAYGKIAWQSTWGQSSGLPGGFGSGVDAGTAFPPILVFYWT